MHPSYRNSIIGKNCAYYIQIFTVMQCLHTAHWEKTQIYKRGPTTLKHLSSTWHWGICMGVQWHPKMSIWQFIIRATCNKSNIQKNSWSISPRPTSWKLCKRSPWYTYRLPQHNISSQLVRHGSDNLLWWLSRIKLIDLKSQLILQII